MNWVSPQHCTAIRQHGRRPGSRVSGEGKEVKEGGISRSCNRAPLGEGEVCTRRGRSWRANRAQAFGSTSRSITEGHRFRGSRSSVDLNRCTSFSEGRAGGLRNRREGIRKTLRRAL